MVDMIKSVCRNCIFANWIGKRQMGCTFNRIYKFARRGVEVIKAYDENDMEFFIINGRICNHFRDLIWENKNRHENIKKLVKKESAINYALFLSFKEGDITEILEVVNNLKIPPVKFFILNRSIQDISKKILKDYPKQWEVINILNEEEDDWHIDKHIMSKRVHSLLYLYIEEKSLSILPAIIYKINYIINEELNIIEGLRHGDKENGGLLLMHEIYGKNFHKEIKNSKHIIDL